MGHFLLGQTVSMSPQVVKECTALHILHEQVDVGSVEEVLIQPGDIWMVEEGLQFDLPRELPLELAVVDGVTRDLLDCV